MLRFSTREILLFNNYMTNCASTYIFTMRSCFCFHCIEVFFDRIVGMDANRSTYQNYYSDHDTNIQCNYKIRHGFNKRRTDIFGTLTSRQQQRKKRKQIKTK